MRIQAENPRVAAATGIAVDDLAVPELASAAVKEALANAGSDYAHSVILFLTSHFARHAQPSVSAAARAARCLQVSGCTVPGLFTEQAWALDRPAAAALVLCGPISLGLPRADELRLTLALPSRANANWITGGQRRFGTLAGDGEETSGGQAWTQGKTAVNGRIETAVHGGEVRIGVSRGIEALTPPLQVTDCDGFEVLQLGGHTALDSLLPHLHPNALPPQRIFAAVPDSGIDAETAAHSGRYMLVPILHANRDEGSVTLASPLPLHSSMWWALRDPVSAERDMSATLDKLAGKSMPAFGLMFSCIGRGPYFYQGHDRDTALVRERFPGMPLIGTYGAGEIAPLGPCSGLISYSSLLALASAHV